MVEESSLAVMFGFDYSNEKNNKQNRRHRRTDQLRELARMGTWVKLKDTNSEVVYTGEMGYYERTDEEHPKQGYYLENKFGSKQIPIDSIGKVDFNKHKDLATIVLRN